MLQLCACTSIINLVCHLLCLVSRPLYRITWVPTILSQRKVILSQSDYVTLTDSILKTEYIYLPTVLYYCIIEIKALIENSSHYSRLNLKLGLSYRYSVCLGVCTILRAVSGSCPNPPFVAKSLRRNHFVMRLLEMSTTNTESGVTDLVA